MKIQTIILAVIATAAFAVTGCKKQESDTPVTPTVTTTTTTTGDAPASTPSDTGPATMVSVSTSKIEAAFATADAATKTALEPVIASVKKADFAGAVTQLKSLGEKFKLTDEQQAAVNDLIAQAQKAIADLAARSNGDATKAASDLTKSLGK